jgi:hypothetical protein
MRDISWVRRRHFQQQFDQYEPEPLAGRVTGASDLVDVTVALHHETPRAVLVSIDGDESKSLWIQRNVLEIERQASLLSGRRQNGRPTQWPMVTITLPKRTAKAKGLI